MHPAASASLLWLWLMLPRQMLLLLPYQHATLL